MKKYSGPLFALITVMVLGVGLYLPRLMPALQSRRSQALVQKYAVRTIELETTPPAGVDDVLRLMGSEHKTMLLKTGNVLTVAQASQAALDILTIIAENTPGLDLELYPVQKQTPTLVFTQGGEDAAVVWQCEFASIDQGGHIIVYLDDETGKMVSFVYVEATLHQQPNIESASLTANLWKDMLMQYYDTQSAELLAFVGRNSTQRYDLAILDAAGNSMVLPLEITYVWSNLNEDPSSDTSVRHMVARCQLIFNLFTT